MFDSKFVNRQYLRFMNSFQIHTSGAGEVPLGFVTGRVSDEAVPLAAPSSEEEAEERRPIVL
jgi:hypothetical protein